MSWKSVAWPRNSSLQVAVALEKALGIPAEVWMNLQTQYDLDTAKIAERDDQRETIAVTIPVRDRNLLRELVRKFGWVCVLWEQNRLTVIADWLRTFDAHKPSVLPAETTNLRKPIRRNEETIPLILLNDSIEFVQRFHWHCSTIPMELLLLSAK